MREAFKAVCDLIKLQQEKYSLNSSEYQVGELLQDIAKNSQAAAELLAQDLTKESMDLRAAAKKLQQVARKAQSNNSYAMGDAEARNILRDFYGVPAEEEQVAVSKQPLSLADFLD